MSNPIEKGATADQEQQIEDLITQAWIILHALNEDCTADEFGRLACSLAVKANPDANRDARPGRPVKFRYRT